MRLHSTGQNHKKDSTDANRGNEEPIGIEAAFDFGVLLVVNRDNFVVGKISPTEIVKNMDPIYYTQ